MSNANDFVIEDGVLKRYIGSGGDVAIPDGVISIGNYAFRCCDNLTSVTIPDGVASIGYCSFAECKRLYSVSLPETLTDIGEAAFYECDRLASVVLPDSVNTIGELAFSCCKSLADSQGFVIIRGILFDYCGAGGKVAVPDGVTRIGKSAFDSCETISSITIPDSVISIGDDAFSGCDSLVSITVPDRVTSIGERAFHYCKSLSSVTFPVSLTSIGKDAFWGCGSLTSVVLPDNLTTIGKNAFWGCGSLTSVVLPNSLTSIGDNAFSGCPLSSIVIPEGVTNIGDYSFSGCRLTSAVLPDSLTRIGRGAFQNCKNLTSITVPEGVTELDSTFGGCENLESVVLSPGLIKISADRRSGVFFRCLRLKTLDMNGCRASLESNVFGEILPMGLTGQMMSLYPYMTDSALKQYVLNNTIWPMLEPAAQAKIFLSRQGKTLEKGYADCISSGDIEPLGKAILHKLESTNPDTRDCAATAAYMKLFNPDIPVGLLQDLYEKLKQCKSGAKAVKTIEADFTLMEKLGGKTAAGETLSPAGQKVMGIMIDEKTTEKDLEIRLKDYYSLTFKDLPGLKSTDGKAVEPLVSAWLLTAHEGIVGYTGGRTDVDAVYDKPGLRPEAEAVVALLDQNCLQSFLIKLADCNLGLTGRSKKMFLAYPICRYADEQTMAELTKRAPGWRSTVSGNDAPPLASFRTAALYSNTRAAMMFAEKYHDLYGYAVVRGTNEDTIRDRYLSDVGLDERRGKSYDLGNQTVTARLQKDLSFLIELPDGKTAKSLPKKGADPDKYEAASKDFSEMKKSVKKILKNRGNVLFADFLDGRSRPAADWQSAYLHNPLLWEAASLIVWSQDKATFTLNEIGPVDSAGNPYTITDKKIKVAHPMEMTAADTAAWQKYFTVHGLKQPFAQVWEPVRSSKDIKNDRYAGCMIPYYRFINQEKRGITVTDYDFHNQIDISIQGCNTDIARIDWARHEISMNDRFEIKRFSFSRYTRRVNHIVAYLDNITVWDRVRKDDVSVMDLMPGFTLAQITEFITAAQETDATNVLAALLDFKNANFSDFDPMDEFTLEW